MEESGQCKKCEQCEYKSKYKNKYKQVAIQVQVQGQVQNFEDRGAAD